MYKLPKLNGAYWLCLSCASIFGTNTGDYVADNLHIGHLSGLPWLAGLLALIFVAERFFRSGSALFFWMVIITVRTAATNVGDAFHDFNIGFSRSVPLTVVLFAICVAIYALRQGKTGVGVKVTPLYWLCMIISRHVQIDLRVKVTPLYWLCMIMAGIVGTVGGDFASFGLHLTPVGTALVFGIFVALLLWFGRKGWLMQPLYYWLTVMFIRTAGTGAGDALARVCGLGPGTIFTGLVFISLVVFFYVIRKDNETTSQKAVISL